MNQRLETLRKREALLRKQAKEKEFDANEIAKKIKSIENEALYETARKTARCLDGGMDKVFEILEDIRAKAEEEKISFPTQEPKVFDKKETEENDTKIV